jgi:predicted Zn-dependent protease
MGNLADAGATPQETVTAVLLGYLVRNNAVMAKVFLDRLPEYLPDSLHGQYLWAVFRRRQGELAPAESLLEAVLQAQPSNELARAELAEVFEEQGRLDRALAEYAELARRSGSGETATLGLARVLRKLARFEESRAQLSPLAALPRPSAEVRVEMAQIELGGPL